MSFFLGVPSSSVAHLNKSWLFHFKSLDKWKLQNNNALVYCKYLCILEINNLEINNYGITLTNDTSWKDQVTDLHWSEFENTSACRYSWSLFQKNSSAGETCHWKIPGIRGTAKTDFKQRPRNFKNHWRQKWQTSELAPPYLSFEVLPFTYPKPESVLIHSSDIFRSSLCWN